MISNFVNIARAIKGGLDMMFSRKPEFVEYRKTGKEDWQNAGKNEEQRVTNFFGRTLIGLGWLFVIAILTVLAIVMVADRTDHRGLYAEPSKPKYQPLPSSCIQEDNWGKPECQLKEVK